MIEIVSKRRGPWYRFGRPVVLARVDRDTLESAHLAGSRLDGASLRDAVLNRAKLAGASLQGADLWGAKLTSADLQGAQLRGADLSGAVLVTANLCGARLDECNLWGANLAGARLTGASLAGADLSGARLAPANLAQANLNGARLTNAYLVGTRLEGATLRGAALAQADLSGATLCGANLDHANLHEARLVEADLSRASLRNALLAGASLHAAVLEEANLLGAIARMADLGQANLRSATLINVDLSGGNLAAADMTDADLHEARLIKADLRRADLNNARLPDAKLDDIDGRELSARGAILSGATLCRANLAGADLREADLRNANLWGADLQRADLRGANLLGAILSGNQRTDAVSDAATQWPVAGGRGEAASDRRQALPPVFREHRATVVEAVTLADGSLVLSGDVSGAVILWDVDHLRPIHHFVLPSEVRGISACATDGIAAVIAAGRGARGDLRLWNIHSLSEALRLTLPQSPERLLLSPDGATVVVTSQNDISAWRLIDQQQLWHCTLPAPRALQLQMAGDNQMLCATQAGLLAMDVGTGNVLVTQANSNGPIVTAAFSANGRHAATVGDDSTVRIWAVPMEDLASGNGEPTSTFTLKQPPRSIGLSPDGARLAYVAADHRLRMVGSRDGDEEAVYELPGLTGRCIRFSPDGRRLLVGGEDHCVRVFSTEY